MILVMTEAKKRTTTVVIQALIAILTALAGVFTGCQVA